MDLLSHPFRLRADGSVATVLDGTNEAHGEGVAVLALTRKGERGMVPTFGIPDPVFDGLSLADLNVGLTDYGPAVNVTGINITYPTATTERVELTFDSDD